MVAPVDDPERDRRIKAVVGTMAKPLGQAMAKYSDAELRLILDFLDTGIDFLRERTVELRDADGEAS